jgi:hypothetical protein
VEGRGPRIWGLGLRVESSGLRVEGIESRKRTLAAPSPALGGVQTGSDKGVYFRNKVKV